MSRPPTYALPPMGSTSRFPRPDPFADEYRRARRADWETSSSTTGNMAGHLNPRLPGSFVSGQRQLAEREVQDAVSEYESVANFFGAVTQGPGSVIAGPDEILLHDGNWKLSPDELNFARGSSDVVTVVHHASQTEEQEYHTDFKNAHPSGSHFGIAVTLTFGKYKIRYTDRSKRYAKRVACAMLLKHYKPELFTSMIENFRETGGQSVISGFAAAVGVGVSVKPALEEVIKDSGTITATHEPTETDYTLFVVPYSTLKKKIQNGMIGAEEKWRQILSEFTWRGTNSQPLFRKIKNGDNFVAEITFGDSFKDLRLQVDIHFQTQTLVKCAAICCFELFLEYIQGRITPEDAESLEEDQKPVFFVMTDNLSLKFAPQEAKAIAQERLAKLVSLTDDAGTETAVQELMERCARLKLAPPQFVVTYDRGFHCDASIGRKPDLRASGKAMNDANLAIARSAHVLLSRIQLSALDSGKRYEENSRYSVRNGGDELGYERGTKESGYVRATAQSQYGDRDVASSGVAPEPRAPSLISQDFSRPEHGRGGLATADVSYVTAPSVVSRRYATEEKRGEIAQSRPFTGSPSRKVERPSYPEDDRALGLPRDSSGPSHSIRHGDYRDDGLSVRSLREVLDTPKSGEEVKYREDGRPIRSSRDCAVAPPSQEGVNYRDDARSVKGPQNRSRNSHARDEEGSALSRPGSPPKSRNTNPFRREVDEHYLRKRESVPVSREAGRYPGHASEAGNMSDVAAAGARESYRQSEYSRARHEGPVQGAARDEVPGRGNSADESYNSLRSKTYPSDGEYHGRSARNDPRELTDRRDGYLVDQHQKPPPPPPSQQGKYDRHRPDYAQADTLAEPPRRGGRDSYEDRYSYSPEPSRDHGGASGGRLNGRHGDEYHRHSYGGK